VITLCNSLIVMELGLTIFDAISVRPFDVCIGGETILAT
jgi:hypothetical protein